MDILRGDTHFHGVEEVVELVRENWSVGFGREMDFVLGRMWKDYYGSRSDRGSSE